MIYLTWFFVITFTTLMLYSLYKILLAEDFKNYVLWFAAALVFCDNVNNVHDKLIEHYEQDKTVKEVSV